MKATVIINPNSGKRHKKINIKRIKDIFDKYGYDADILFTEYRGHARKIACEINTDLLISVGGDGTFNEVMSGNFARKEKLVLSHIPLGTANDIGAMYGYSRFLYHNFELLLRGKIKNVDICTINGEPFTYVAALGKFTNVSYDTPRHLKKRFGYLAYLIEGLKEFSGKPRLYNIEYKANDIEESGRYSFVLISNANRIAGINNIYKNIKLDDNSFEVLLCELKTKKEVIKSLYHMKRRDITTANGFKFFRTNSLVMNFDKPLTKGFSVDGEELKDKDTTFKIDIVRNIKILIPDKNIKKLFLDKE